MGDGQTLAAVTTYANGTRVVKRTFYLRNDTIVIKKHEKKSEICTVAMERPMIPINMAFNLNRVPPTRIPERS